jgi:hypothetical protein
LDVAVAVAVNDWDRVDVRDDAQVDGHVDEHAHDHGVTWLNARAWENWWRRRESNPPTLVNAAKLLTISTGQEGAFSRFLGVPD